MEYWNFTRKGRVSPFGDIAAVNSTTAAAEGGPIALGFGGATCVRWFALGAW